MSENLVGVTIDKRYKIVSLLGSGGMGTVYSAVELGGLDRVVALKLLNRGATSDRESRARFLREGRTLSALLPMMPFLSMLFILA
ncbi:MAG: hypothetical protein K2W95_18825 [Candidatus Obscuribacterales bacterium]|nr:hypothetical protein [Candidatus Obscuribacterales bacterium]